VRYRCGTQEYGVWNDEVAIELYSPTSAAWSSLLGEQGGVQITAELFEAAWDDPMTFTDAD
jgi:hypothetical protein